MITPIFHLRRGTNWRAAQTAGAYARSSQDEAGGFIHFSAADQAPASASKHRAGQTGLVVLAVDADAGGAPPLNDLAVWPEWA